MSKNTFGKIMPRALTQQLQLMGEQIMLARKRRHLSMQDIADRATVTRLTVSKVEHGDPTVSMGIYARILFALNLEKDLSLLAAGIVILPPAGEWYSGSWTYGSVWTPYYQGVDGLYWSSSCADATGAMSLEFFSAAVDVEWNNKSKTSLPVRLVKNK